MLTEFFERRTSHKGARATFIALIPKFHGASSLMDFRPISLIGSLYKINAKVLAQRLKVMVHVISKTQGAFMEGRQITNGILVANECVDYWKKSCTPGLICKIDLDKVNWNFLEWVLSKKGFGLR